MNPLLRRLKDSVPVGMQFFTGDHTLIEVLGRTGFDYVWLDSEHCATNPRALEDTIRTADGVGLISLVRIPEPDDTTAARRALEAGAHGLIVPMVRSAVDIQHILDATTYPPDGRRGICPAYRAAGYSLRSFGQHAQDSDADLLVIPLIETLDALENIEEICAIEQVRVLCFAAGELAFAMGEGARMHSSPKIKEAHAKVNAAAARHNVALMGGPILNPTHDSCAKALEDGIRVFCLGIDVMAFRGVCEKTITALNSAVAESAYTRPPAPESGFPDHY
ncbi:HpcH/HpaI aldolase/citrate lyase family protein [Streptomyces sp. NPDC091972]|uniref:HpcH/HpaI aldolase family protein n=1 Tax=Streptomyces sp. NPDC091972 TaxID=3366007 RepID=UPI00382C9A6A